MTRGGGGEELRIRVTDSDGGWDLESEEKKM